MTSIYEDAGIHIPKAYRCYKNPIDRTMHVTWNNNKLVFTLYYGSGPIEGDWEKDNIGTIEEIYCSLSDISILIEDIARKKYTRDEDIKSVIGNMKGVGESLFQRLLPDGLSTKAKDWRSGMVICISTNESWIPWEMLNDGKGFWGQRFLIFRMPRLSKQIELDNTQMKKDNNQNKNTISKVVHVIGGGIDDNYVKRAKTIFDIISDRVLVETLEQTNFANLMKQSGEADILHFTCHCHDGCLQISGKPDKQINLLINSIKNTDFVIRYGSIIFANACGSSSPRMIFGDFVNFGWEFIKKGASIFIGTIGTIPTESAIVFAESFYGSLFENNNNQPTNNNDDDGLICKSFLKAKDQMEKGNDFWHLLYCMYGNPICFSICFKEVKCQ